MALLTKAQIFGQKPLTRDVEVAEWGGAVRVKAQTLSDNLRLLDVLTVREREVADYEADQALPEDEREGLAKVARYDEVLITILMALVDENDDPLLDPVTDYSRMLDLSYASIALIHGHIVDLRTPSKPVETIAAKKKPSKRTR